MILKINDRIRNRQVKYFNQFNLSLKYDAVGSAFAFQFYFNPDNQEHKELACIGHFHECTVEHNGELLLTGVILSEAFKSGPVREMVPISGYSLPGVLEDCEIPPSVYPLQNDGLSLKQIAEKLIEPFKLKMSVDTSVAAKMNAKYETTTAKESQSVKSYLTELAAQKNIIISHNEKGELLFTSAKTNRQPIATFKEEARETFSVEGKSISTGMDLSFNGQAMHSHITVMKQADSDGGNAGESTVRNPFVIGSVYRPRVIVQNSGDDNDTEQAAKNALAAELKNLKLTIRTARWEIDGKIIKPNNIISVTNPEIYLYKESKWFVESIDFVGDNTKTIATLNCVLPCVYDGTTPEYLFKGINLH